MTPSRRIVNAADRGAPVMAGLDPAIQSHRQIGRETLVAVAAGMAGSSPAMTRNGAAQRA